MGGVTPEDLARIHTDEGLLDDMAAVRDRSLDLLVKHGIFHHERGGLRPSREFFERWMGLAGEHGSLYVTLGPLVREWTGGALLSSEVVSMCTVITGLFGQTELGETLDRERRAIKESIGAGSTYEGIRGELHRARKEMEGRRL